MKIEIHTQLNDEGILSNLNRIRKAVEYFNGKEVTITIKRKKNVRTSAQNKYYWAICNIISNDIGYTKEEVHEILKYKFLRYEVVHEQTGEILSMTKSTTELSRYEFGQFVEELARWCAITFNIVIPQPDEQFQIGI